MSVHGEYSRALETLIARLRALSHPERDRWLAGLEAARVDRQPDLSTAATVCRSTLAAIDASLELSGPPRPDAPGVSSLTAPWEHLLAHCQIILGRDPT